MGSPGLEGMNGAGFVALLFAPAVDRWVERFDAWVEGARYGWDSNGGQI